MGDTPKKVSELAAHVGGRVIGDGDIRVHRVASLDSAEAGDIAYVEDEKFFEAANQTKASCVIAPAADLKASCRIVVKNPKLAFSLIAEVLHPPKKPARSYSGHKPLRRAHSVGS